MILPNVRASFGRAEAALVVALVTRGEEAARAREEDRVREEGFDALLDDPRTLNALMASGGITAAPAPLVFYLLVRHALLEGGVRNRTLADYLAAVLLHFGRRERTYRVDEDDPHEFFYLADVLEAIEASDGHRAFLLRAHLGEFALWLSGLFPDFVAARVERRSAPGIAYYEELGAAGFRMAAGSAYAEAYGMDGVYRRCADGFPELRVSLNRVADRHLFPVRGDRIGRLLRQVTDELRTHKRATTD